MLGTSYISPLNSFPDPYSFKRQIQRTSASGAQEQCDSQALNSGPHTCKTHVPLLKPPPSLDSFQV